MNALRWITSPSSLRIRIFRSLVPIFLALFALVGIANVQLQRSLAEEQFRKRGIDLASNLAYASELGVLAEDRDLLESSIRTVSKDADVAFISVYDATGHPVAEGGARHEAGTPSQALSGAHRTRLTEEQHAFSTGTVQRGQFIEFYAPILSASVDTPDELLLGLRQGSGSGEQTLEAVGFVRLGLSLEPVRRRTAALLRLWAGLAGVFLVLAVAAVYFFSESITRPINFLTARAKDIAHGDLDHAIPIESRDEIGQLASTFNEMAQSLKSNITAKERFLGELQELNQSLERRIRDRTAELEELYRLSASMQEPLSLREALSRVLDGARDLVGIDRLCIWALTGEGERLIPLSAAGVPEEEFAQVQAKEISTDEAGALGRVIRDGAALLYAEGAGEAVEIRLEDLAADPKPTIPKTLFLLLPVLARGSAIGVLACDNRPSRRPIGEGTLTILQTFAAHASSAIENAQLFQELDDQGREIEAANRHKSEFLANMSHELRTPLNAVIGFSEVLLERMFGELNDKQDEYLNDILSSGRHLLSLINDILDLSKIEAGQMEIAPNSFDLPIALGNAMTLVRERAQRRGVKVALDVDMCPETLVADERKFKQVLLNLLSNAVKFTESGGSVSLRAAPAGDGVEFSISDTGIGIAPADQERIFEAFRQAEGHYVRKSEGTGLGLTLSRRIVELHGGRLWVESALGEGSTFSFSLPIRDLPAADLAPSAESAPRPSAGTPEATSAAQTPAAEGSAEAAGQFVLVVEDDRASANLMAIHLKDTGIAVRIANDGKTGLELATRLRPRAIVLDILLPKLDGWEFLTRLRANPDTREIPVVIVSNLEERGKGLALGAADYLIKPYDAAHLVESLQRVYRAEAKDGQATVLAIDDDPRALALIRATLEPHGFVVITALSGQEGIETAKQQQPDLIVLDLMMPGLDGFEVSKLLKDDPETSSIPIVVLTVRSLSSAEKRRLSGRIDHLGRKTEFRREDFVSLVRTAIERREQSVKRGAGI